MSGLSEQTVVALISLALFSLPAVWLLPLAWRGLTSRYWPTTTGVITRSTIQQPDAQPFRRDAQISLDYKYQVNDTSYSGNILCFGDFLDRNARSAYRKATRYPVGAMVTVYYHPQHPEIATLEPRPAGLLIILALFSVSVIGSILYSLIVRSL